MSSDPVLALIFFLALFSLLLLISNYCEEHKHIHFFICSSYNNMIFIYLQSDH